MQISATLWNLNLADQEFDDKTRRLQQVETAIAGDPALDEAKRTQEASDKTLAAARTTLRNEELNASSLDSKIKELEQRLYAGLTANPKELDGLNKDLQMHKNRRASLDDTLLTLMEKVDQCEKTSRSQAAAVEQAQAARSANLAKLEQERADLSAHIAELDAERTRLRAELGALYVRQYDQLRRTKGGRAVAQMRNDSCAACGVAVPTGLARRVRAGEEIVTCTSCGRILAG